MASRCHPNTSSSRTNFNGFLLTFLGLAVGIALANATDATAINDTMSQDPTTSLPFWDTTPMESQTGGHGDGQQDLASVTDVADTFPGSMVGAIENNTSDLIPVEASFSEGPLSSGSPEPFVDGYATDAELVYSGIGDDVEVPSSSSSTFVSVVPDRNVTALDPEVDFSAADGSDSSSPTDITGHHTPASPSEKQADEKQGQATVPAVMTDVTGPDVAATTLKESSSEPKAPDQTSSPVDGPGDWVSETSVQPASPSPAPVSETTYRGDTALSTEGLPMTTWYVLIIQGNCSLIGLSEQEDALESRFETLVTTSIAQWLDISPEAIGVHGIDCGGSSDQCLIHVNLTISQRYSGQQSNNISDQMGALEESKSPLLRVYGQSFYVYQVLTAADGVLTKVDVVDIPMDMRHSDVELLIYIAVGSVCAFLLVLAVGLLACKYCDCCKDGHQKAFDFGDTSPPNFNMRLEDYTLTQIPRPKLGYTDYCRGLTTKRYSPLDDQNVAFSSPPNGLVRAFDTSVVPLEDVRTLDPRSAPVQPTDSDFREFHDGIIVRPLDIPRFGGGGSGGGGSLGRMMCHGGGGGRIPLAARFCYPVDTDGYCVRSTENLHENCQGDRYVDKGVDNPNFH